MNLLSLILIFMAIIAAGCVFYVAWQFSSGEFEANQAQAAAREHVEKEPGESKDL